MATPPALLVTFPRTFIPERSWAMCVLLEHVLGITVHTVVDDGSTTRIACGGEPGHLELADGLFAGPNRELLDRESVPSLPLRTWDVRADVPEAVICGDRLPVLYGAPEGDSWLTRVAGDGLRISADLLGGAFFLMSRLEEAVTTQKDVHGRFPGALSLAHRAGILDRPIVNEYAEVIFRLMRRLWPRLERSMPDYGLALSHDVDLPFCRDRVPRRMLGDLVTRHDPGLAARRAISLLRPCRTGERADVCDTFDRIMDGAEAAGIRTAFYFLCGGTGDPRNADYRMGEPRVDDLMKRITMRGHEVGLHPSYHTFDDPEATSLEFATLRNHAARLGIDQQVWGGRQHYLRWQNPITWQNWSDAGLDYDSTLSFADLPGFRCGICVPFPVFSLTSRQPLRLMERPLVVMDGTLLEYQRLSPDAALASIAHLANRCRRVHGQFTLLWHNDRLASSAGKRLFAESLLVAA